MKATARFLLSATTVLGLTAFTVFAASPSVVATSLGLLVVYGLVEMTVRSYAPRPMLALRTTPRLLTPSTATVSVPAMVEFPSGASRARAA